MSVYNQSDVAEYMELNQTPTAEQISKCKREQNGAYKKIMNNESYSDSNNWKNICIPCNHSYMKLESCSQCMEGLDSFKCNLNKSKIAIHSIIAIIIVIGIYNIFIKK